MKKWAEIINKKYGEGTVTLELKDQYYNMREKIEPVMHTPEGGRHATYRSAGIAPPAPTPERGRAQRCPASVPGDGANGELQQPVEHVVDLRDNYRNFRVGE